MEEKEKYLLKDLQNREDKLKEAFSTYEKLYKIYYTTIQTTHNSNTILILDQLDTCVLLVNAYGEILKLKDSISSIKNIIVRINKYLLEDLPI